MKSFPEHVKPLSPDDTFTFNCHPDVTCFNECCRELELLLTPFDVIRLKNSLHISSQQFLEQYAVIEFDPQDQHPMVYLGMVDDGRASCPYVRPEGCTVYADRPGACRTYPVGRGAYQNNNGETEEIYILISEPHCCGFSENNKQTIQLWQEDQGIVEYNHQNDNVLHIFNHQFFKEGNRLTQNQADKFILALYNLDQYKQQNAMDSGKKHFDKKNSISDDVETLQNSCIWLEKELF